MAVSAPRPGSAKTRPLRIGVLTDLTGPYALVSGRGSVAAAEMAARDFAVAHHPGFSVEIIPGDCRALPGPATEIATAWLDRDGVDAIADVPGSEAALAVSALVAARDRVALFSGPATSLLTGRDCTANQVHWTYDTWSLASGTGRALVGDGGRTWFFITADNEFGHRLEQQTTGFVEASGGQILGRYAAPFGTTDFSDAVVEAAASGAQVVALANAGADMVSAIRQAASFGLTSSGTRLAGLLFQAIDAHAIGTEAARGVATTEAFYWDRNDASRAFAAAFAPRVDGLMPGMDHAGVYSAVTHYLRAVASLGVDAARASGRVAISRMKVLPTDDPLFGPGRIRADGRKLHDMFLMQVKTPMEQREPWDVYTLRATIPAASAFRPMEEGSCPLVPA